MVQKGSTEFWTRIAGLKVQSANPSHHRTLSGEFAMTFEVHFYVFHGWEKKKRRKLVQKGVAHSGGLDSWTIASLVTLRSPECLWTSFSCLSWLGKEKKKKMVPFLSRLWTGIAGLKVQSANPLHHRTLSGDFAWHFAIHCYVFHGWEKKRRKWCNKVVPSIELASLQKSRVLTHHTINPFWWFAITFEVHCYVFHGWEKKKRRKWCKKVLPRFELASLDWKSRVLTHHTIEPFLVTLRWPLKFIVMSFMVGKRRKEENSAKRFYRDLNSHRWIESPEC